MKRVWPFLVAVCGMGAMGFALVAVSLQDPLLLIPTLGMVFLMFVAMRDMP